MDYLHLLPQGIRVVIEVDGKQHYARNDGQADPVRYAEMVSQDRELQLAGYHVFRFGASELTEPNSESIVKDFFTALFSRFGVQVAAAHRPT
jgi:very-short-patch-repair endonuclease